ncbi:MAG: ATPase, T2SS/T4P/T4SS family [Acidimicrobiia bacterium]
MRGKKKAALSLEQRLRAVRESSQPTHRAARPSEADDAAPESDPAAAAEPGVAPPSSVPSFATSFVTPPPADSFDDQPSPIVRDQTSGAGSRDHDPGDTSHLLWAASEGDTLLASGAVASVATRPLQDASVATRPLEDASPLLELVSPGVAYDTRQPAYEAPDVRRDLAHAQLVTKESEADTAQLEPETLAGGSDARAEPETARAEPETAEPETARAEPDTPAVESVITRAEPPGRGDAERLDAPPSRRLVRMGGLGRRRAVESNRPKAERSEPFPTLAEPQSEPARSPEPAPGDEAPWSQPTDRIGRFGRIGTTMIERGLITNEQLDAALDVQRTTGRRVGEILVGMNALSRFELARVLADHMGVPFVDLRAKPPDAILGALLPEEVARRYRSLVIDRWNNQLVIAMANPSDLFALDDLQMVMRQPIITAMAVEEDLLAAIDRVYRVSDVETTLDAASDYVSTHDEQVLGAVEVDEGPVVRLVNALLEQAIRDRASDLHVEPSSTRIAIRFRVDGVLHDSSEVPLALLRPLVSRLKILSNLDIAQNRLAQDGRFSVTVQGRPVDVRVVTVPTATGESVILRLLDPTRDTLDISSLGLNSMEEARFIPPFFASQGAALIVGPTGSGKTSTVYTLLSKVNTRSKSIISVEDPVEYRLDGIKQIQANPRVGVTFANTLPSILRSDPDIVFIGEVRDAETARIAADASITGHLVLSTLHATRSAAAPMRLIEMGVEPYLVASALTLVAAQRLARKLCDRCAQAVDPVELEHLRELGADEAVLDGATVRRAVGCPACRNTGYLGRLPILEIMPVTEPISRLILDRAPRAQIERLAVEEGMETMRTAAMRRVATGVLSIEEMMRIIS